MIKFIQLHIVILRSCYQFKVECFNIFQRQAIISMKKALTVTGF